MKKANKKFKKPKWMDQYCVRKVKKKYQAWKRFTHSHSYRDYAEYCKLRNSAAKAVKFAKKKYQKGIAESVQKSPKSFWSHVKEEIKSKSSIGDLKDKNGEIKTDNKDKAEILNDFFASVFTVEGDSVLPNFEQKVTDDNNIHTIDIKPEKVLKQLKNLNVAKSCGPDNCPYFLKACVYCLLCWGLTTRQPLWVILCRLPEKGRKEIEEIVEEMKEKNREERGTGMKGKKQKK